ncbi:MAG: bifunctional oligoribonuclease/PAP phosphatase NrnA [Gemmatales bacterium]|nr:bifunctional oligoribonuclease/PAP phosphatase NrnA [Gemmatales bacterium]MCS7159004.1 bifunctional oligoribonuclease/PAP phosphatase NrnA [Gemmatales bacterium]MDW8174204.1 bifunctional oligoribonuclease/PAP phosphatase NrnA [Gemmatales bacterium]MDW8222231.1 bifunctional oligoribonuclease/PAP phosphatase NrnA [Gemmatales bacterium]
MLKWQQWCELVSQARNIALLSHVRPDGDALGSCEALRLAFRSLGKQARVVVPGHIPERYRFLDTEQSWESVPVGWPIPEWFQGADLLVIADTGTWAQLANLAEAVRRSVARKVVLDHHQTQDDLNAVRFVDTSAEATGRLAWWAILRLRVKLTPDMARALFVAIATDTGWFHHSNTQPRTFDLARRLIRAGADPHEIYQAIYECNSLERLRLIGLFLQRLQLAGQGRICYGVVRLADYEETGAPPLDSDELIGYTRSVAGVEVGLLFVELPQGGTKVSFRARGGINVASLAERWKGGGHPAAAGAILDLPLAQAIPMVVSTVEKELARPGESFATYERS